MCSVDELSPNHPIDWINNCCNREKSCNGCCSNTQCVSTENQEVRSYDLKNSVTPKVRHGVWDTFAPPHLIRHLLFHDDYPPLFMVTTLRIFVMQTLSINGFITTCLRIQGMILIYKGSLPRGRIYPVKKSKSPPNLQVQLFDIYKKIANPLQVDYHHY